MSSVPCLYGSSNKKRQQSWDNPRKTGQKYPRANHIIRLWYIIQSTLNMKH